VAGLTKAVPRDFLVGSSAGREWQPVELLEACMSQRGQEETLFGHPVGLFTLFFAEMWERFSYYGMRTLLIFYMSKDFLGYDDKKAYAVYGAYTALVYATPFIGGILADRILGRRQAVIIGGTLMAAGHLLMTWTNVVAFYVALALLVVGNGYFKPNISTMVGSLYPPGSERQNAGFTLFYMGINLGAAMSPLVCGYVGQTFGWHKGFGLATIGMVIGLCIFIFPPWLNMVTIGGGAIFVAYGLYYIAETWVQQLIHGVIGGALLIAAAIAVMALKRGGLPDWAGAQPEEARAKGIALVGPVYAGTAISVPLIAWLLNGGELAKWVLYVLGAAAVIWLLMQIASRPKVQRERLQVVLVLMFFSLLFWAFFEQAGSSLNNFTDRNVDRVVGGQILTKDDVGKKVKLLLNEAQLGYEIPPYGPFTIDELDKLRSDKIEARDQAAAEGRTYEEPSYDVELEVKPEYVGMDINGDEIPASQYQAANPVFILVFGLVFSALWTMLAKRNIEPSIPIKFGFGLLQLGLGFFSFYWGALHATDKGLVAMGWLILGYLLHTTGELCISPVGLSMVTKLSPKEIVSATMGIWFLATAFSNLMASAIAQLTGVSEGKEAGAIPPPIETLHLYSDVFYKIGIAAIVGAVLCWALSPWLVRWTNADVADEEFKIVPRAAED
jgi:POT family proton-dependent oligopeptide transporter